MTDSPVDLRALHAETERLVRENKDARRWPLTKSPMMDHIRALDSALRSLTQPQEVQIVITGCEVVDCVPSRSIHPSDYASRVWEYLALRKLATPGPWQWDCSSGAAKLQLAHAFLKDLGDEEPGAEDDRIFIAASHTAADLLEEGLRIMEWKV